MGKDQDHDGESPIGIVKPMLATDHQEQDHPYQDLQPQQGLTKCKESPEPLTGILVADPTGQSPKT